MNCSFNFLFLCGQAAQRRSDSEQQVQDLLCASERLQEENRTLNQLTSDRTRGLEVKTRTHRTSEE